MNIVSVDKKIEEIIAPYVDMGATATISLPPDCPKDLYDVLYVVSYHCGGKSMIVSRNKENLMNVETLQGLESKLVWIMRVGKVKIFK